jgi:hypothetical protein
LEVGRGRGAAHASEALHAAGEALLKGIAAHSLAPVPLLLMMMMLLLLLE